MLCNIINFTIEALMCKTDTRGWVECLNSKLELIKLLYMTSWV